MGTGWKVHGSRVLLGGDSVGVALTVVLLLRDTGGPPASKRHMGEHIQQGLPPRRTARKHPSKLIVEEIGRRLMEIIVHSKDCGISEKLSLDDLAETGMGDWTTPNFRAACAYAASQGWLIVGTMC